MSDPQTICKIEDISPFSKFNYNNEIIDEEIKNSNKNFKENVIQNLITNDMYKNINKDLIQELKDFCKKYN